MLRKAPLLRNGSRRKAGTKERASKRTAKTPGASRKGIKKVGTEHKKTTRKNTPQQPSLDRRSFASRSGTMAGDLQGLRNGERADSESISELLEEGNAFEAGIVTGVEEAEDNPETEVQSHEVPQDGVPKEYLDKD